MVNPQTWLLWLSVIREVIKLIRLVGAENARDTIREKCTECTVQQKLGGRR